MGIFRRFFAGFPSAASIRPRFQMIMSSRRASLNCRYRYPHSSTKQQPTNRDHHDIRSQYDPRLWLQREERIDEIDSVARLYRHQKTAPSCSP